MAKTSGVTDWHKQQHKKQVQKNKEARIAARDERVVQEKTVQQVRDEIKQVERHHKNVEQRPHAIKSKLDRLQKELKLLQSSADEKAKEDRSKITSTFAGASNQNPTTDAYVELERPEVSVYYDALMNPYGAPPPGQPRLYHRRGGGTTTQLFEACTLQEQFAPPPPPPPPRTYRPVAVVASATQSSSHRQQHGKPIRTGTGVPSSRLVQVNPPHQTIRTKTETVPSPQSTTNATKTVDPALPPALPPPSASVQRCFTKSVVDIWASNEEVEYEAAVSSVALEGIAVAPTPVIDVSTAAEATCWFYKDNSNSIQGPYPTDQMKNWVQAGFFPLTTLISADQATGPWRILEKLHMLTGTTDRATSQNTPVRESSVQDRISKLRRSENLDQGNDKNHNGSPTVADRIAALQQERLLEQQQDDEDDKDTVSGVVDAAPTVSSVQDRIAALKANSSLNSMVDETSRDGVRNTLADRINALRAQHDDVAKSEIYPGTEESVPPPPPPSVRSDDHVDESLVVAPYPLDEESAGPYMEYPLDEMGYDISYPIEDGEDDVPVTGAYDTMDDSSYPDDQCTDELPPHQSSNTIEQTLVLGAPPKKKIRLDKAVIALLPSHLRRKAADVVPR